MKSNNLYKSIYFAIMLIAGLSLVFWSCEDEEFSKNYDIDYPMPTINSVSPEVVNPSGDITIEGSGLDQIYQVLIDGQLVDVKDTSATKLVVKAPRVFSKSNVEFVNLYKRSAVSEGSVEPEYPETVVSAYPDEIAIGSTFKIEGTNMDFVNRIVINDEVVSAKSKSQSELEFDPEDLGLIVGDIVVIELSSHGEIVNATSPEITVVEGPDLPVGADPILFYDFEDSQDRYTAWTGSPVNGQEEHGINYSAISPHTTGGDKYQTVQLENITEDWAYFGEVAYGDKTGDAGYTPIDLSTFRDPHITFLVNTQDAACRIMYEVYEDEKFANHVDKIDTEGKWQWVSIPINNTVEFQNWGSNGWDGEDPDGELDYSNIRYIQIGMGTGDVGTGNDWVINMDNFQVTDGPVQDVNQASTHDAIFTFWDFEDASSHWVHGDWQDDVNSTGEVNAGGLTAPEGGNYMQVSAEVINEGWNWYGNLEMFDLAIDLSETLNPHISFYVHNDGTARTFEMEIGDANEGKWGTNFYVEGSNEWQLVTINLNTAEWGNWGADTDVPDLSALKWVKVGFNANELSAGNTYKTSVDYVILTNGPAYMQRNPQVIESPAGELHRK